MIVNVKTTTNNGVIVVGCCTSGIWVVSRYTISTGSNPCSSLLSATLRSGGGVSLYLSYVKER